MTKQCRKILIKANSVNESVLYDEEPEPPSPGRGVAPEATEDRGVD